MCGTPAKLRAIILWTRARFWLACWRFKLYVYCVATLGVVKIAAVIISTALPTMLDVLIIRRAVRRK